MLLLGGVSAFPQKLAENCSIVIPFAGRYIAITLRCHGHEVHESACGHGPDPGGLDERYIRSKVMVHRKLDEIPGEMCTAADEDLWSQKMGGVRIRIFLSYGKGVCIGCSGRVAGDAKREK